MAENAKPKANIRRTVLDSLEWGTDEFVETHSEKKTKPILPEGVHQSAIYKDIVHLAWPTFIELTLASLTNMVDMMMVGNLGPSAISSVSLAGQPKFILMTVFMSMCTGSTALVARCRGANDQDRANHFVRQSLTLTFCLSVISMILGLIFIRPLISLMDLSGSMSATVFEGTVTYLRIQIYSLIPMALTFCITAVLRGAGKTRSSMIYNLTANVVNVIFNYLLIEGRLGFPRLEVAGDAIATVCGTFAACVFSICYLRRSDGFLHLKGVFTGRRLNVERVKQIRNKSAGIVSENILTRVGFLLSGIILSTLDSGQTAVYYVTMILLNYTFAIGDGLQTAALTLIGRSIGAKDLEHVRGYNRKCLLLGLILSAVLSGGYLLGAEWFYGRFFSDREAVALGVRFTYVAAVLTFLQILRLVNIGTMRGIGDVKAPMAVAIVCVLIVNPGMSYLLTVMRSHGIWGIWQASMVSQSIWFLASFYMSERDLRRADLCLPDEPAARGSQ